MNFSTSSFKSQDEAWRLFVKPIQNIRENIRAIYILQNNSSAAHLQFQLLFHKTNAGHGDTDMTRTGHNVLVVLIRNGFKRVDLGALGPSDQGTNYLDHWLPGYGGVGLSDIGWEMFKCIVSGIIAGCLSYHVHVVVDEMFGGVKGVHLKRRFSDEDAIRFLVDKLRRANLSRQDWKFSRMMKQSGLRFTEPCMLRIVESLGEFGEWRHALSVVEWVYAKKEYKHSQSRFVYTKLLAVLGKARRPNEALQVYNKMREDCQIYPDMPACHSIAVTLGQAGLVKELLNVIEYMKQKPSKRLKNMRHKNWDPCLDPDVVIYNALLNACIPSQQWKGVPWVLKQMRHSGVKPTETTYGLAMEVMLKSAKYDLVHKFFGKMRRSGLALKALTYKVVVRAFWEEGKVDEAVQTVRNMEERGVVGSASLYYELACCLCNKGGGRRLCLRYAYRQVEKLKRLPLTKPLEVTFTGMIQSCLDGGYVHDCLSIFELMKDYCTPNIGTVNLMLKIYGRIDMFAKAKDLFEATKMASLCSKPSRTGIASLTTDVYTYSSMLEASANAHQWEYFEYVYKEMSLCNYQLDQQKHARLLVEASRAGKWHLLEHAFDTILDAGDIPDLSLFTEMICQTIFRQNYEKVFSLMKYMIHTPLQISEKQWMDVFRKSRDRIGNDELKKMLHCLENSSITSEPPVCGLLNSLQLLCTSSSNGDDLSNVGLLMGNESKTFSLFDNLEKSSEMVSRTTPVVSGSQGDDHTILQRDSQNSVDTEFDSRIEYVGESFGSGLPSASEILQRWGKSMEGGTGPYHL
ncbi:Pentatricopeptide repeat-containing protein [Acorus calamus]|uniref:Pentatricopeptide repeat-containing protein n=1 Tax=Acorus calamus TaxID=4465 RepID=A0AAV9DJ19_ACOCL|nr:Pentatricopeptide repeat-containing protein [Acorus calamus]